MDLIMVVTLKMEKNNTYFALLPFINSSLLSAPESLSAVNKIIYGVLTFTIILLYCIINIIGYFGVLYIIKYTDLQTKYPKLSPIIKYYQNTSFVFLIIEIIFVIFSLLLIIFLCIHLLYISNNP